MKIKSLILLQKAINESLFYVNCDKASQTGFENRDVI